MIKTRILIVEDDVLIGEDLVHQVSSLGYHVLGRVYSGEEAIRLAEQTAPDVVLMDIKLSGKLDGIAAAEVIRKQKGSAIVFLTAHTQDDFFQRAKRAEPSGYLAKPVTCGELERTLDIAVAQHRTERRLIESERRFDLAVRGANLGLWDVNLKTHEAVWNERMAEMIGYTLDELAPITDTWVRSWWFLVHPDDWHVAQEAMDRHLNGNASFFEFEHRFRMKSGAWKWVYAKGKITEFDDQGVPLRITGTTLDISDRKKAEEDMESALATARELRIAAEQATKAKSRFLANMSHELRTPLHSIIGFAEILEDQQFGSLNERQARYTGHIVNSGRHLLNLINDILDLSKVESGKMEIRIGPIKIVSFLKSCLALIRERAQRKNVELKFESEEEIRDMVASVDDVKLKQIMFNLLSNAVKFTPDNGSISVDVSRPGKDLLIRVSDTGIGLRADDLDKVFESFEQLDTMGRAQPKGTGLGLALTRKLVELHGGRIWAESQGIGKGSTFSFSLPVIEQN